ncbi:hypothetical protein CNECB9_620006 [Cupriavidus necator]|uniref:Uncharacterized protein n=1 Tax=Cupriavidus necator TaxID=106590 RepID=A0A1K0JYQ4_CUPNE|nr:hypothetical protein CNECB9_620006 [Cupriavidus necator]
MLPDLARPKNRTLAVRFFFARRVRKYSGLPKKRLGGHTFVGYGLRAATITPCRHRQVLLAGANAPRPEGSARTREE